MVQLRLRIHDIPHCHRIQRITVFNCSQELLPHLYRRRLAFGRQGGKRVAHKISGRTAVIEYRSVDIDLPRRVRRRRQRRRVPSPHMLHLAAAHQILQLFENRARGLVRDLQLLDCPEAIIDTHELLEAPE